MIEPGSLVGFGFVFVLVAWTLSGLAALMQRWCVPGLRGGPALERVWSALAALVPVGLALGVSGILIARSFVGADHCLSHDHRAHLCLWHGAPWARDPAALLAVGVGVTLAALRLSRLAVTTLRQRRTLRDLRRASRPVDGLRWLDTPTAVCFVTGSRRPEIFVSTGAWHALDPDERAAMLAHERAHVTNHDLAWRFALDACLAFGAPFTSRLRRSWDDATERLCDATAAREAGDPTVVASALVKLARLTAGSARVEASFAPLPDTLTGRVEAVLAEHPIGAHATRGLVLRVSVASLVALVALASQATALHDVMEHWFG